MEPKDITVRILEEIRDSIRETNAGVDQLRDAVNETNARLDETNKRIVEAEIRTATAITALGGTLENVRELLKDRLQLRDRLERCEQDIIVIKERTGIR